MAFTMELVKSAEVTNQTWNTKDEAESGCEGDGAQKCPFLNPWSLGMDDIISQKGTLQR